jgi:hypothetical protein
MEIMTVSNEDMRAARMLTGATFSLFVLAGVIPGLRPYATRIRIGVAVLYFVAAAGFVIHLLVR